MFKLSEEKNKDLCVISAFRGSSKSTIFSTSLPIWKIISGQSHFVVIASQTQYQTRQIMSNIKKQLETNNLLRNDLGPFDAENNEWGFTSGLIFKQYDAKLMVVSTEQAIRGLRYKQYRPDLIILDDIEDLNSTRTQESRDKIFNWFSSEILPLGTPKTKIFVLGNFLHEYSLVGKLIKEIDDGKRIGIARKYPLFDEQGRCLWPDRFTDTQSVEDFKKKIGDEVTFLREYMLKIISTTDQVIKPSWIRYYDKLPDQNQQDSNFLRVATGIDLAISEKETADYTAMVSAKAFGLGKDFHIYILPNPVNEKMDAPKALRTAKEISEKLGEGRKTELFIENVGYQEAFTQLLRVDGFPAIGVSPGGQDKRARLSSVAYAIENGIILFSKDAQIILNQILYFGSEKHDDLLDAFVIVVEELLKTNHNCYIPINSKPLKKHPIFEIFGDVENILDKKF
ncbi:MAG: hypothetical protein NTW46_03330 [Candidatus Nealsonbacteria bacterium]|nr:hypothetical protein [Candidatus Nealsonbacteria bacterium]